jgi:hypothetical protein
MHPRTNCLRFIGVRGLLARNANPESSVNARDTSVVRSLIAMSTIYGKFKHCYCISI